MGKQKELEQYRKKIIEIVEQTEDVWILKIIHNFIVKMIKEGD